MAVARARPQAHVGLGLEAVPARRRDDPAAVESDDTEAIGQQLPAAPRREYPVRILGIRLDELDGRLGPRPHVAVRRGRLPPARSAWTLSPRMPRPQSVRSAERHHRPASDLLAGPEEEAVDGSRRTADGEAVRGLESARRSGDRLRREDAVRRDAPVADPLSLRIEAQPVALSLGTGTEPGRRPAFRAEAVRLQDRPHGPLPAAGQLGAVALRRGLEVADGALLFGVMVGRAPMAGKAEGARRLQRRDGALRVALVAGLVRIDRGRVRLDDFRGSVTGGAVSPCGVVVLVAGRACSSRPARARDSLGVVWHFRHARSPCSSCPKGTSRERGSCRGTETATVTRSGWASSDDWWQVAHSLVAGR